MKLYQKRAWELSDMLRTKKVSAAEICREVSERIKETGKDTNSYITVCNDALSQAEEVDRAIADGRELHPLAGIPIAVKDNISVKGMPMTCGSRMLESYVPLYDASVITKLRNAGMVITGKANMDEFAMGSSTETSYFGAVHNPYNYDYTAGGSSGRSASAVSAGEAILALGSDTGGSIRQPASFCGITGLKPTYGSVSRYGLIAFASSLEQIGPMGKDVRDTAMLYGLICGHDPMDATTYKRDYSDYASSLKIDVKGLRVGVPEEYFGDFVQEDVKNAVYSSIKLLESNGATVKSISLPNTKAAVNTYYIISSAEASSNLARFDGVRYGYRTEDYNSLREMYERTRSEGFGKEVKRRIMLGTFVLSSGYYDEYYIKAQNVRRMISHELSEAFRDNDVIITPTYPVPAFKSGKSSTDILSVYAQDICTVAANISGIPAINVPCGTISNGLPVGMQIMGKHFSEKLLFDTAYAFERITDGIYTGGAVR